MKLALVLAVLLAGASTAGADVLNPPGGPVYVEDGPADDGAQAEAMPIRDPARRGDRMQRPQRDPQARRAHRQRLREALLDEFDANGDGRLGPRERMRAIRVLRRIEGKLAGQHQGRAGQQQRAGKLRKFIQRYDRDGDGNVGPNEVPQGAANKLRRLDRDGDGWVEPRELRRR